MIVPEKTVEDVKRIFDLNLYEARLWLALLSRGISTAGELSEISAVPRSRTYDVLESLKDKGLITVKRETRPVKYVAMAPSEALEQVNVNFKRKMEEQSKLLDQLRTTEVVSKLKGFHVTGSQLVEKHDKAGLLRSRKGISHCIDTMLRSSKKMVEIIATPLELKYLVEHHLDNFRHASETGVKIKIAGPFKDSDKELVKLMSQFAVIKTLSKINARIFVRDEEELLFSLFPMADVHPIYDTAVWVHSPFFAKAMSSLMVHASSSSSEHEHGKA